MKLIALDYYRKFHCVADKCGHNCCIGWEIDVDEETLEFYRNIEHGLGKRLCDNIDFKNSCFKLTENERCPFLNDRNLCDIISRLGESGLCQICDDHPRFRSYFSDRTEIGLGLCCEAAGKLILGNREKVGEITLDNDGEAEKLSESETEILSVRKKLIEVLQNRSCSIETRVENLKDFLKIKMPRKSIAEWAEILRELERLSPEWDVQLNRLSEFKGDFNGDSRFETELEQLLVYFIYRHCADADSEEDLAARAAFAVLGYMIIGALCKLNENCTLDDVVEYARLFSSEIEYSDENTDYLIEFLRDELK